MRVVVETLSDIDNFLKVNPKFTGEIEMGITTNKKIRGYSEVRTYIDGKLCGPYMTFHDDKKTGESFYIFDNHHGRAKDFDGLGKKCYEAYLVNNSPVGTVWKQTYGKEDGFFYEFPPLSTKNWYAMVSDCL